MSSCPGCLISEKERQELIDKKSSEAKEHAVKEKKIYVLYDLPDRKVEFMSSDSARAAGITPIKYISFL